MAQAHKEEDRAATRHILIAVDDSENSMRAVLYVADLLGGSGGVRATVLNVIDAPPEDFFATAEERAKHLEKEHVKSASLLAKCKTILTQAGFDEGMVQTESVESSGSTIADCILEARKKHKCCTVALGRRGISKKEEFLFGSTSSRVIHEAGNCAVWVIE